MDSFLNKTLRNYRSISNEPICQEEKMKKLISFSESLNLILLDDVLLTLSHTKIPEKYNKFMYIYNKGVSSGFRVEESADKLFIVNPLMGQRIPFKLRTVEDLMEILSGKSLSREEGLFLVIFLSGPTVILQLSFSMELIKNSIL